MRFIQTASFFALLLGIVGCGAPDNTPSTFPVSGKVLLPSGEPAHGSDIKFIPKSKDGKLTGADGFGTLNADGTFSLKSMGDKQGVPAGYYAVVINPRLLTDKQGTEKQFGMKNIPQKYWSEDTTDYFITVDGPKTDLVIQIAK